MKKNFLLIFAVLCFFGCSVEPVDPYLEEGLDHEQKMNYGLDEGLKMSNNINECTTMHYFGEAGIIEVTNDGENLHVTITASSDFSLIEARLQVSRSYDDFPLVGGKNLPPGNMEIHKDFSSGVKDYFWQFPLSDFNGSVAIASFSKFISAEENIVAWAGDKEAKYGNWTYFEYQIVECSPVCQTQNLGEDKTLNYSYVESLGLVADDLLEALGYNNEGFPTGGRFEPSLQFLVEEIQNNPGDGPLSVNTTYTVGEGECVASVDLILKVACPNAGEDQSGTLEFNCADNLDGLNHLKNIYLSLLEEGVITDGTFDPTMEAISKEFEGIVRSGEEIIGKSFTTTYTVGSGECVDTVDLSIEITPSVEGACEKYDYLM